MFETVYTLWYYWDGPREGVADFRGRPHVFVSEWDEAADDFGPAFLLKPIGDDTLRLVMEDWAIFRRWEAAVGQGLTTFDTHPASAEDRVRREDLKLLLREPLTVDPTRARQAYPVRTWAETCPPAVDLASVVKQAAEFCPRSARADWDGYALPPFEVRWAEVGELGAPPR